jgi:hypothetical protein
MGKNQKIPYLKEVLLYFSKIIILLIFLSYLVSQTSFYNQSLLFVFVVFAAFSFNIFFIILIALSYAVCFFMTTLVLGDSNLLLIYSFSIFLNTIFMFIYFKYKYKFKEE